MHTNNHCKQCTTSNIHVPMSEHMEVTQYYLEFLEFWKIKHMCKQWIPDPFLLFFLTGLETRLHTLSSKSSYLTCFKHRALWLMQLDSGQPSFPGSCAWAKKKEPGLCMLRISENLDNFHKICSITLTSTRPADLSHVKDARHWPCSAWTMTRERRRHSALHLQELFTHSSIPAKRYRTWLTQSSALKFINRFEQSNADHHCHLKMLIRVS